MESFLDLLKYAAVAGVLYLLYKLIFRETRTVLSNWHHTFDNLDYSPQEFFDNLSLRVDARQMPSVKTRYILYKEKKIFGYKRKYYRAHLGNYVFDICAAPFGTAFFVSFWFAEKRSFLERLVRRIEAIGQFLDMSTYYEMDTRQAFCDCVQTELFAAIDAMTTAKGMTALEDTERIPTMPERNQRGDILEPR